MKIQHIIVKSIFVFFVYAVLLSLRRVYSIVLILFSIPYKLTRSRVNIYVV